MADVNLLLFGVALIIFFGFMAEFIFKKIGVPDILLLVMLGFLLGPNVWNTVDPAVLETIAPLFTTFALMFLMFEGSTHIDLGSFARGLFSGSSISIFNFTISSLALTTILALVFSFEFMTALLIGFVLSGVSSAFVIPVLKQLKPRGDIYTMLTLESALTDVYTIVFALTVLQIIKINAVSFQAVLNQIASLFAIACFVGFIGAMIWIFLDSNVFRGSKGFMSTIAFLILLFLLTEYLGGNGAIASMFFGIFLKNSKQLTSILSWVKTKNEKEKKLALEGRLGVTVISEGEERFFAQISFFLKTFFFVYIGFLLNVSNWWAILIGVVLAVVILFIRKSSILLTKKLNKGEQDLINAVFARGLAAAAVIQIVMQSGVLTDPLILDITYITIVSTIILSSAMILIHKIRYKDVSSAESASEE
ncbi:cation:proton antiporter [Candidatus Woesearchaeota archaeon]|nr:cation:proton antiporter [Candidatus Woesearchaeota archaeon]